MNKIQIPSHWQLIKLGEYCEKPEYGYTASATENNTGYKFLRITDIQAGTVKWENVPYCEFERININKYLLIPGDIVIARIGATTGKSFFIDDCPKSLFASYLIRIRAKAGLLADFLNFYFDTALYWQQINSNKGGKLKGGVNIPIIQNLLIPLPPVPEQKAIAYILRTIQKAKKSRQRELELERERKAALMEYLFTHGTRNETRKQTEIGEIPDTWSVVPFISITISGTQNGIYKNKEFYGQGYQIADMKDIFKGEILEIGNMDRLDLDNEELLKFRLHEGDLIFARRSFKPEGAGKCQIVPTLHETVVFSSSLIRVSLKKEIANPRFYAYFFNSQIGNQLMRQITRILAVSGISGSDLKKLPVPMLTEKEQQEIVLVLEACDRKIQALEKEISLIDELFHATLEQLMTGQISTQPLTEVQV